jgi:hypothetical protein
MLTLFAEAMQLLGSGIPALQQLGSQLLQQLPAGLQQLGQDFQNGTLTLQQAFGAASAEVGTNIHGLEQYADYQLRGIAKDLGIFPPSVTEAVGLAGPAGPTGPLSPEPAFSRASARTEFTPAVPDNVVAGTTTNASATNTDSSSAPVTPEADA